MASGAGRGKHRTAGNSGDARRGRADRATGQRLILSNNHVIANSNDARWRPHPQRSRRRRSQET